MAFFSLFNPQLCILPNLRYPQVMVSLFTLLVWLPRVASEPADRGAWTGFFISWIIGAAAWVVAQQTPTTAEGRRQPGGEDSRS